MRRSTKPRKRITAEAGGELFAASVAGAAFRDSPKDGLAWGLELHRWTDPREWPAGLERVPAEHRAAAEDYLRGIAKRMRTLRTWAKADGFDDVEAWRDWRRRSRTE